MKRVLLLGALGFISPTLNAQLVRTNIGTGTNTTGNLSNYTQFNNTGTSVATFSGNADVSTTQPSGTYTGASAGSNVEIGVGETFDISFNSGDNVRLLIAFGARRTSNNSGTNTLLINVNNAGFNPIGTISETNQWSLYSTNAIDPLGIIVPANANIVLRFAVTGNNTNYALRVDDLSISSLAILPLTTRNFTAAPRNGKVQLDWTGVATHISAYFEVERSDKLNGTYSTIAKIPVSSIGEAAYRFMDNSPLEVDNFYRIRIVDENQKVTYTRSLQVRLTGSHLAINNLFPTLVQGNLNLVVSNGNKGDAQVEVIDMAGRIAFKQTLSLNTGSQTIQLDVSRLTRGSYTVLLRKGDQAVQSRFIKQ